jgi:hypothetical protein
MFLSVLCVLVLRCVNVNFCEDYLAFNRIALDFVIPRLSALGLCVFVKMPTAG